MEPNCSAIFLLRHLEIDRQDLKDKALGFMNSFLRDSNKLKLPGYSVYLLFKPKDKEKFEVFVELEKERTPYFLEEYDYGDEYSVIQYQLPIRFEKDYQLFEEGKYSKFSKEFKSFYTKDMRAYDIVHKEKVMIDYWTKETGYDFSSDPNLELWSKPDMDKETLDISKF